MRTLATEVAGTLNVTGTTPTEVINAIGADTAQQIVAWGFTYAGPGKYQNSLPAEFFKHVSQGNEFWIVVPTDRDFVDLATGSGLTRVKMTDSPYTAVLALVLPAIFDPERDREFVSRQITTLSALSGGNIDARRELYFEMSSLAERLETSLIVPPGLGLLCNIHEADKIRPRSSGRPHNDLTLANQDPTDFHIRLEGLDFGRSLNSEPIPLHSNSSFIVNRGSIYQKVPHAIVCKEVDLSELGRVTAGDVRRIATSRNRPISNLFEIPHYVEDPLLEPMTLLFEKGIRTTETSAHSHGHNHAFFELNAELLSGENLQIAEAMGGEFASYNSVARAAMPAADDTPKAVVSERIIFRLKIDHTTPAIEIRNWAMGICENFKSQSPEDPILVSEMLHRLAAQSNPPRSPVSISRLLSDSHPFLDLKYGALFTGHDHHYAWHTRRNGTTRLEESKPLFQTIPSALVPLHSILTNHGFYGFEEILTDNGSIYSYFRARDCSRLEINTGVDIHSGSLLVEYKDLSKLGISEIYQRTGVINFSDNVSIKSQFEILDELLIKLEVLGSKTIWGDILTASLYKQSVQFDYNDLVSQGYSPVEAERILGGALSFINYTVLDANTPGIMDERHFDAAKLILLLEESAYSQNDSTRDLALDYRQKMALAAKIMRKEGPALIYKNLYDWVERTGNSLAVDDETIRIASNFITRELSKTCPLSDDWLNGLPIGEVLARHELPSVSDNQGRILWDKNDAEPLQFE